MNVVERLNNWLGLIANFGVIIGIVFLVMEISQSNRISIGTAEAELRSRTMNITQHALNNTEIAVLLTKLRETGVELTPVEQVQARTLANQWASLFRSAETAHRQGLLSEETFSTYVALIPAMLDSNPGYVPYFSEMNNFYDIQPGESIVFDVIRQESTKRR